MLRLIWLIRFLPLVGVAINGLFGKRFGRAAVAVIGCGVVLVALGVSAGAVLELSRLEPGARFFETTLGTWIPMGPMGQAGTMTAIPWGLVLDPLSAIMFLVVTAVGFLIHVYTLPY